MRNIFDKIKNKNKKIFVILIFVVFLFTIFFVLESYFKKNDYLSIFHDKILTLELLKRFIPDKNNIVIDDFEVKIPYGYEIITTNTAIGLFSNIRELENKLNQKYEFVDKLGSNYVWKDSKNNKLIFLYIKRYAKINYLRFEIKKYVSPDF